MKTSKLLISGAIASLVLPGMLACADTMYRIDTQINGNGSGVRTIYARGDSASLSGDTLFRPFLFSYTPDWRFETVDTIIALFDKNEIYTVGIHNRFRSIDALSKGLVIPEEFRPLLAPKERWEKHFRWFYTYYSFEAVYPRLSAPVSIDQYMTIDEQKFWFQGDFSIYRGMSGFECMDKLNDLETKYHTWYTHNRYEVSFATVRHFAEQIAGNPCFAELENVKDTVFALNLKNSMNDGVQAISPEEVCSMLDAYYRTAIFSNLFLENKEAINRYFNEQVRVMEEAPNKILLEYHLIFPGKVFQTNAAWNRNDTLIWKINGIRLYASEDYRLTAESRKTNVWAFVVTFLIGLGLMVFGVRRRG